MTTPIIAEQGVPPPNYRRALRSGGSGYYRIAASRSPVVSRFNLAGRACADGADRGAWSSGFQGCVDGECGPSPGAPHQRAAASGFAVRTCRSRFQSWLAGMTRVTEAGLTRLFRHRFDHSETASGQARECRWSLSFISSQRWFVVGLRVQPMSLMGQSRRFDDVRDVSASPSAAAEPVHHGEPAR